MQNNYINYAHKIIKELCAKNLLAQKQGYGPFSAAICGQRGEIIELAHNSVVNDNCALNHAETNVIRIVQKKFNTYDLSAYNFSLCITAEPCIMCVGAIMWSGIKSVYFGLPSKEVEKITSFDEGYKPNWINIFAQKGISVTGNIEVEQCKQILLAYVKSGKPIYNPH